MAPIGNADAGAILGQAVRMEIPNFLPVVQQLTHGLYHIFLCDRHVLNLSVFIPPAWGQACT